MSIIQKDGGTYDSGKRCGYTRKMYSDNIGTLSSSLFYNMDIYAATYIQQYKYLPYMPFQIDKILQNYTQIVTQASFITIIKQFYQRIRKMYRRRIIITLIGTF